MEVFQNNEQEVKIEAGAINSETASSTITLEIVSPGMLANLKNGDGSTEAKFICKYCSKPQSSKSYLIQHENNHIGVKPFSCDECNYSTSFRKTLTSHKKNAHNKNKGATGLGGASNICKQCGHKAANIKSLELHEKMEHENAYFKCATCGFMTKELPVYKNHIQTHKERKKYTCGPCNYETIDNNQYLEHKSKNHSLKCPHCKYLTFKSDVLTEHIQRHKDVLQHFCLQCTFSANLSSELVKHSKTVHENEVISASQSASQTLENPDDLSNKSGFLDQNSILYEYRKDSGVQEMSQKDISVLEAQSTGNIESKAMHTNLAEEVTESTADQGDTIRKKYKCSLCNFTCAKKIFMAKHEDKHTNQKSLQTNFDCSESKRNTREDEDNDDLQCEKCTYKASTSGLLLNHKRIKHDEIEHLDSEEDEIDVSDDDQFVPKPKKKKGKEPKRIAWICIDLEDAWRTWPN